MIHLWKKDIIVLYSINEIGKNPHAYFKVGSGFSLFGFSVLAKYDNMFVYNY